jgi:hypothetical protein|tara:strand:+ start:223 stop:489 length:267 start_codon:yes stop_codon:yes gene_type:complete
MAKDYFIKLMEEGEIDDSYNIRGDDVASSRSRGGNKKKDKTKQQQGGAESENEFLNFLVDKLGDVEDVSISVNGSKRIPIKDLKKKIN